MNKKLQKIRQQQKENIVNKPYQVSFWKDFDYTILSNIKAEYRKGAKHENECWNDVLIMADTETSKNNKNAHDTKTGKYIATENHLVIWTLSIRAYHHNICTLYGRNPFDFCNCLNKIQNILKGNRTLCYFHNLSYDYIFLRQFWFKCWGYPERQLNTKSHYPISIEFGNGWIFRDSLILSQCSLEKWGENLNVQHQKAVGSWDYDKIRNQDTEITEEELHYAEFDTLCGVECLDSLQTVLNKHIYAMPYTATGIVRNDIIELATTNKYRKKFTRIAPTYQQYLKLCQVYHGGYTHANRYFIEFVVSKNFIGEPSCKDFCSSYPNVLLSEKYPSEKFWSVDVDEEWILSHYDDYASMFHLRMTNVRLKDEFFGMPCLQFSKLINSLNVISDNGRVLSCDYCELVTTEVTLKLLREYYYFDAYIYDVEVSSKNYLPRWLTDYIFELFKAKSYLKGVDVVNYNMSKSKINSVYGLHCTKSIRDEIEEDYGTGEYHKVFKDGEEEYQKYLKNRRSVLLFFTGVWVTEYAMANLFELGKLCDVWLYSDTDSVYGIGWREDEVEEYNKKARQKLADNGYYPFFINDKEFCLGLADDHGHYLEGVFCGAKRYALRKEDGSIKITVAGVPKKKGSQCLKSLHEFKKGFVFKGEDTGKLTHIYIYDDIHKDSKGNWCADSVDLIPCDYELDSVEFESIMNIGYTEEMIQYYEEN